MPNWLAIENSNNAPKELKNSKILENQNDWTDTYDTEVIEEDPKQNFIKNMGQEFKDKYWENFDIDKFNYIANNIIAELIKEFWADKGFEIFKTYWKESISNIIENYNAKSFWRVLRKIVIFTNKDFYIYLLPPATAVSFHLTAKNAKKAEFVKNKKKFLIS